MNEGNRTALRNTTGFTLVEILAATALFAVLGTMLFQVVQGAMTVQSRGERLAGLEERSAAVMDLMVEDLQHLWTGVGGPGEQDARFLCSFRELAPDPEGSSQWTPVLRFTRLLHEARSLAWLRRAGEQPAAQGVTTLTGVADPRSLAPTGGLAESLYTTAWLPGQTLPGLVRRVRSPVGGAGSLLAPALPDQPDRLLEDAVLLADGVLHFGLELWAPDSTAWVLQPGDPGRGAVAVWDSTRGLIPRGEQDFPYGAGPESLFDGRDDLFPTWLRLTLVLDPFSEGSRAGSSGRGAGQAPGRLAEDLDETATRLVLASATLGGDDRQPSHLWVEGEWMLVTELKGRVATVKRGNRHTQARSHQAGVGVRIGTTFRRVVRLPTGRENHNP